MYKYKLVAKLLHSHCSDPYQLQTFSFTPIGVLTFSEQPRSLAGNNNNRISVAWGFYESRYLFDNLVASHDPQADNHYFKHSVLFRKLDKLC